MSPQNVQALILWSIVLAIATAFIFSFFARQAEDKHHEAFRAYKKGEAAQTPSDREGAFRQALMLYKQLEDDYQVTNGTGKLQYNIANTYFQLAQYPAAVLYYQKALKLDPWNDKAQANLNVALSKLQISNTADRPWWQIILSPSLGMSEAQRFQMFFALCFAAVILASFYLWKELDHFKRYAVIAAGLAIAFLISISLSYFTEPTEAIVLRPTSLYRDAGKQYVKVQEAPIAEGVKLEIQTLVQEGRWAKVRTSEGSEGFVPIDRIGII